MTEEAYKKWKEIGGEWERRNNLWKNFYWTNSGAIMTYANKRDIRCSTISMTLSEAFSSVLGEKAIRKLFPDAVKIERMRGMNRYDFDVTLEDGRVIHIEVKFRTNDSTIYEYSTDRITLKKTIWMSLMEDPENSYIMVILWDGTVRVYKADEYREGDWNHNITTAEAGKEITESFAAYDPSTVVWTTSVSVPIC